MLGCQCDTSSDTFQLNHWVEMQHVRSKFWAFKTILIKIGIVHQHTNKRSAKNARFCDCNQTACFIIVDYSYISGFMTQLLVNDVPREIPRLERLILWPSHEPMGVYAYHQHWRLAESDYVHICPSIQICVSLFVCVVEFAFLFLGKALC